MSWNGMCGFDLETTGVDTETARVVTAAVVRYRAGEVAERLTWVADPGVEIPAQATAVHGYTTEAARAAGLPADIVIAGIIAALVEACRDGLPIVIMNAAYDLTVLDREAQRHGLQSLFELFQSPRVLDPRVLDKQFDTYRPGGRRLTDLCRVYGVTHGGAHEACADSVAACAVTEVIGDWYPWLVEAPLNEVHDLQVRWAADQQDGLRDHFARTPGKEAWAQDVRTDWPVIPRMPRVGRWPRSDRARPVR